jgi:hypothetical protein
MTVQSLTGGKNLNRESSFIAFLENQTYPYCQSIRTSTSLRINGRKVE